MQKLQPRPCRHDDLHEVFATDFAHRLNKVDHGIREDLRLRCPGIQDE